MVRHQQQVLLAGVTAGALRCSTTSSRMVRAFSTRFISCTYSQPAEACVGHSCGCVKSVPPVRGSGVEIAVDLENQLLNG